MAGIVGFGSQDKHGSMHNAVQTNYNVNKCIFSSFKPDFTILNLEFASSEKLFIFQADMKYV